MGFPVLESGRYLFGKAFGAIMALEVEIKKLSNVEHFARDGATPQDMKVLRRIAVLGLRISA